MFEYGFTLIEIIIVIALLILVCALGLAISLGTHRQTLFENDVHLILDQISQARSDAIHNKNNLPHGLRLESRKLVLFKGSAYQADDPSNQTFIFNTVHSVPDTLEIIFQNVTGTISNPLSFTLTDGFQSFTITVNAEGAILD